MWIEPNERMEWEVIGVAPRYPEWEDPVRYGMSLAIGQRGRIWLMTVFSMTPPHYDVALRFLNDKDPVLPGYAADEMVPVRLLRR